MKGWGVKMAVMAAAENRSQSSGVHWGFEGGVLTRSDGHPGVVLAVRSRIRVMLLSSSTSLRSLPTPWDQPPVPLVKTMESTSDFKHNKYRLTWVPWSFHPLVDEGHFFSSCSTIYWRGRVLTSQRSSGNPPSFLLGRSRHCETCEHLVETNTNGKPMENGDWFDFIGWC